MTWSHPAGRRAFWLEGQVLEVEGIGRGRFVPPSSWIDCEPEGCGPNLEAYRRDEQEAGSRQYGAGSLTILPLSSGRWAVFGPDRQLIDITEGLSESELRQWSEEGQERVREARKAAKPPQAIETEEDLGL